MHMDFIHLAGRPFDFVSKNTISLSNKCFEASIIASRESNNGTG
jgi:hypothetical protein